MRSIQRRKLKHHRKDLRILFLPGLCCLIILGGCASDKNLSSSDKALIDNSSAAEELSGSGQEAIITENIGEFSVQDITGESYTQEMFSDYNLTLVNVFTTWCTPCVNEIPDLEKLKNEMENEGVNVVGIVLDAIDGNGGIYEETVEKAKLLAEKTGASYPFLIPDANYLNGKLSQINAVPETFFVDKEGNIVGETYVGSHPLEEWKEIVSTTLKEAAQ